MTSQLQNEAVCQLFENVNTGGVPFAVFELITATFATEEFDLRADWDTIPEEEKLTVLNDLTGANFLTAMPLFVSHKKSLSGNGAETCKKRDILRIDIEDYKANRDAH